eukprot:scaffold410224_cov18-Prasinocladus_malaysianus.AAC.1
MAIPGNGCQRVSSHNFILICDFHSLHIKAWRLQARDQRACKASALSGWRSWFRMHKQETERAAAVQVSGQRPDLNPLFFR